MTLRALQEHCSNTVNLLSEPRSHVTGTPTSPPPARVQPISVGQGRCPGSLMRNSPALLEGCGSDGRSPKPPLAG
eukprot:scaffold1206_cov388-Prasinococcus_capsulatus_cf.AAC.2